MPRVPNGNLKVALVSQGFTDHTVDTPSKSKYAITYLKIVRNLLVQRIYVHHHGSDLGSIDDFKLRRSKL